MKFEAEPGTQVSGVNFDGSVMKPLIFDKDGKLETKDPAAIAVLRAAGFEGKE